MCVKKIEAYTDSKAGIHVREDAALLSEIAIITGYKADVTATLRQHAEKLLPLLRRLVVLDKPEPENGAAPKTAEKYPTAWGDVEGSDCTLPRRDCECN